MTNISSVLKQYVCCTCCIMILLYYNITTTADVPTHISIDIETFGRWRTWSGFLLSETMHKHGKLLYTVVAIANSSLAFCHNQQLTMNQHKLSLAFCIH